MKRVLIISPHFPPINAADMHRIRQSLMYYKENNWLAEVVIVNPNLVEVVKDELLLKTIPADIKIHQIDAFDIDTCRKFGLGNIAYRSMYYYWRYVDSLLRKSSYDLIFFSTTAFPLSILGRIWKRKFKIPYLIDMQDPWRSDHYLTLPKNQRPPKFWISYTLDKYLEKFAMKKVDGLMSVNREYIEVLHDRYKHLKNKPHAVIPFAAYPIDIDIAKLSTINNKFFKPDGSNFNIVCLGRAGYDMQKANTIFLKAIKKGLDDDLFFKKIKIHYIGTSYASNGLGVKTVEPIAQSLGINHIFIEETNRVSYFEGLKILSEADMLFVPGSDNIGYTASKIYQYAWLNKPLITLFHSSSSVNTFMNETNLGLTLQFDQENEETLKNKIIDYLQQSIANTLNLNINWDEFEKYTAKYQVKEQVNLFNYIIE